MRKLSKHISCLICIFSSLIALGQELPTLGTAPEVRRGSLPNGIQFYLVTHPEQKGFADFALVQRGRRDAAQARDLLRELPHFGARAPYRFLAGHGIGYGEEGYISLPSDAALFTFRGVPTHNESVADSTLLMLFDMAAEYRKPQAIIICGDIDAARVRERMELLSMMVPALEYNYPGIAYRWEPRDSLSLLISHNAAGGVAAINAIYSTARLPKEMMNTPQPLVTQAYADQLGRILGRRMERSFRAAGLPMAGYQYRYMDSAQGPDDERHILTVYTAAGRLEEATRRFAAVLGTLDREGAGLEEFLAAPKPGATAEDSCATANTSTAASPLISMAPTSLPPRCWARSSARAGWMTGGNWRCSTVSPRPCSIRPATSPCVLTCPAPWPPTPSGAPSRRAGT